MTLDEVCDKAAQFQRDGRPELAAQLYEAVLQSKPKHAAANHGVGMLKVQSQHAAESLPYLLAAVQGQPQKHDYWVMYLEALLSAGLGREAGETLALGRQHGLEGAAVESFAARLAASLALPAATTVPPVAIREQPLATPAPTTVGRAQAKRRAAGGVVRPGTDPSLGLLNSMLAKLERGRFDQALVVARALTQRFPDQGLGWKTLGFLLWRDGLKEEALVPMQTAARLLPRDAEAYSNLGMLLVELQASDAAEPALRHALELDPNLAEVHYRLATVSMRQGRYAQAEACIRSAVAVNPAYFASEGVSAHTDLLYFMSHDPAVDAEALFLEHCRYGEFFETPLRAFWPNHPNSRDPERRLKVGFVSGDLCNHAVASFIEPVIARLAQSSALELHAYYTRTFEDDATLRFRGHIAHWHSVAQLSSIELASLIVEAGIDVLIDLSGHTSLNRLRAFARKPAPLQASWCGYPGTTGLRSMDYFLTDRHFLPPGRFDRYFTEKLVFLPAAVPFAPLQSAPAINALPALATGSVTFGSFNRLGKTNDESIHLWAEVLRALPSAKMLIGGIDQDSRIEELIGRFAKHGIARARLAFHKRCGKDAYLALHHHVDICLDTTPYGGGTTTLNALWMGVPTLTVAGSTIAGRQGAAIMGHHALEGFVATDAADFVAKGVYWATHLDELALLRAGLRERCQQSFYQQPDVIVATLERALRHMWRRWCSGLPTESFDAFALPLDVTAP